ncbi:aerolysin family beta-barrel pore-forming toxin [Spartinivicinus poritis]|uniref:Aerolysin family beta-barrel pore-forming toxin n=1 Tax=Spartinivicinus poritis TaxID=2994640 RepID=A0ABT5UDK5_9GAMM|nr:aerolysin family beta-barrel pore-forming toxin [Spartinivicinus sp. A2-2]MDE1464454.1 aerolysin family beta-barrel pore-forming toxin [Spartinivicinus sp. A2-2]
MLTPLKLQLPTLSTTISLLLFSATISHTTTSHATVKDTIPSFQDKLYANHDATSLKWNIVSDQAFHQPLAFLAHYLGYGWTGGTASQYVGEDLAVQYNSANSYTISARYNSNDPHADEYWADKRLKMNIDNIKFFTNPDSLTLGEPQVYDRKPLRTYVAVVRNFASTEDMAIADLKYDQKVSWSKQDNFSFTEKIGVEKTFKAGLPILGAGIKITAEFSATQGWNETNGNEQVTSQVAQYRATIPPKSKRTIYLTLFEQKSDIPYQSKMYMNYNVTYSNFLRWSGNARNDHPKDRPFFDYTFGNRNNLNGSEDIIDQYLHHDIKGYSRWDWPWMINEYGKSSVEQVLGKISKRRFGAQLNGKFMTVDGTQYNIDAGPDIPLTDEEIADYERQHGITSQRRSKRSIAPSKLTMEIIEVKNHSESDTVSNVDFTLSPRQAM